MKSFKEIFKNIGGGFLILIYYLMRSIIILGRIMLIAFPIIAIILLITGYDGSSGNSHKGEYKTIPTKEDNSKLKVNDEGLSCEEFLEMQSPSVQQPTYKQPISPSSTYSYSSTPDDAYNEGYNNGYEQGMHDGEQGYEFGSGFDDSSSYYDYYETKYEEGYKTGYDNGYYNGKSNYEEEIEED